MRKIRSEFAARIAPGSRGRRFHRPVRLFEAAALAVAVARCGEPAPTGRARTHPTVARDADGQLIYVDTHEPPAVSPSGAPAADDTSPWFHRVGGRKSAMLTFDCAWVKPANALDILDTLQAKGVKATFFISGPFIFENYRLGLKGGLNTVNLPIIRRLIDDGHEFGNHTRTHPRLADRPDYGNELSELRAGWDAAVRQLYGEDPPANAALLPAWRAPYGEHDPAALTAASCGGYPYHIGWNDDTHDSAERPRCTAENGDDCWDGRRMTDRVLDRVARRGWPDSDVIVAHLQNPYFWGASGELTRLIDTFRDRGYAFVRVSEALRFDPGYGGYPPGQGICRDENKRP